MAKVTRLDEWRNRDTEELLKMLTKQLKAGKLSGVLLQARDSQGVERSYLTGVYRRDPEASETAALRLLECATDFGGLEESH
jgi:hypothetical protein